MRYKVKEQKDGYTILSYGKNEQDTINVPNELIPFWTNNDTILYYKDGKFNREL